MKRRKAHSKRMQITQLWTYKDAVKAIPYLRSVIASLREDYLEALNAERRLALASKNVLAPKRQQILDCETHTDDAQRARAKFTDALDELTQIGVFLMEPVHGIALIPFRKGDELAWYVFDQFSESGLIGWRNDSDPIDEYRPLSELDDAAVAPRAA